MEITVKIPQPKSQPKADDGLAKNLDKAFARIEASLRGRDHMDMKPMMTSLTRMTSQQGEMLEVLRDLRTAFKRQDALGDIEDALSKQWGKLQKSLQGLSEPDVQVKLPRRFYTALDSLEDALSHPQRMSMPPGMMKKFDELAEAIRASRPKTFGMLR